MKKLRMIFIAITIILIPMIIFFSKDNHENEEIHYDYLEQYYSIEVLNSSYDKLQNYISDKQFIKENDLSGIDFKDALGFNTISGFLIHDEFDFDSLNYVTFKETSDSNLADSKILRFDQKGYYYVTYYNNLYSNQLVPIIIFSYQLDNTNRVDFSFILTENDWELFKINKISNGD